MGGEVDVPISLLELDTGRIKISEVGEEIKEFLKEIKRARKTES